MAELKGKKVPENLITIEEEESNEIEAGTIMKQSLPEGTTYDLSKAIQIVLTVAKKVNSISMPSYIGSSREFAFNNLTEIYAVKKANIEIVEVSTAPEGTAEETVVDQSPKAGEKVDLSTTRVKISIYKAKHTRSSSSSTSSSSSSTSSSSSSPSSSSSSSTSSSRKPNEQGEVESTPTQANSQGDSQRGDISRENQ